MILFYVVISLILRTFLNTGGINANDLKLALDTDQSSSAFEPQIENQQVVVSSDNKFEIVGESSHLFSEEDFIKVKANLLYENAIDEQNQDAFTNKNIEPSDTEMVLDAKFNKFKPILEETNSSISSNKSIDLNMPIKCNMKNLTVEEVSTVKIVNGSALSNLLSNSDANDCFVVMFYLPWCQFCAKLAPQYNALSRHFTYTNVLAIDASKSEGYNTKFGASAVPMIIIFHHLNIIAKYNHTEKNLTDLIAFVSKYTGIEGNKLVDDINLEDFEGPVPAFAEEKHDYILQFSWISVIFIALRLLISKSKLVIYRFKNIFLNHANTEEHSHQD